MAPLNVVRTDEDFCPNSWYILHPFVDEHVLRVVPAQVITSAFSASRTKQNQDQEQRPRLEAILLRLSIQLLAFLDVATVES